MIAVSPLRINGLSHARISDDRRDVGAWIHLDVSTGYMRGPFAPLLSKLFGGQVERNRPERIRELL